VQCELAHLFAHLGAQLARGNQNQHQRPSGAVLGGVFQLLQQGQGKGGGFAGAGLRRTEHIAPLQGGGNCCGLNGGGGQVAVGADGAQQGRGQTQGSKWHEQVLYREV
jgi:hypothetical protein